MNPPSEIDALAASETRTAAGQLGFHFVTCIKGMLNLNTNHNTVGLTVATGDRLKRPKRWRSYASASARGSRASH